MMQGSQRRKIKFIPYEFCRYQLLSTLVVGCITKTNLANSFQKMILFCWHSMIKKWMVYFVFSNRSLSSIFRRIPWLRLCSGRSHRSTTVCSWAKCCSTSSGLCSGCRADHCSDPASTPAARHEDPMSLRRQKRLFNDDDVQLRVIQKTTIWFWQITSSRNFE